MKKAFIQTMILLVVTLFAFDIEAQERSSLPSSQSGSLAAIQASQTEVIGPWNLVELKRTPSMRWLSQDGPVHSLVYAGEKFDGHETEVFAFYASPTTLGEAKSGTMFPGVVLIHGGDISDDWPYQAAASVIRAHSLLRSFPEVIADRTAVTGISWGGYTTCLVASLDDRFKAAVPVYGCGFLFEGESVQKPSIDKLGELREAWIQAYDPSSLLVHCRVPILFVNGTNDIHYPLDSYQMSFDVVPGRKQLRIEVQMRHGHPPGWSPQEIGLFIDSFCRDGKPLPVPGAVAVEENFVRLPYTSTIPLKSASLHYTTDDGLRSKREWKNLAIEIGEDSVIASKPPNEANTWFISLTDQRDAMVTSTIQFQP